MIELLVTMTVLLVLLLMMVGLTNQTNKIWRGSRARISAFQGARNAFERITANLSQSTLNTYLDYYNASGSSRADLARTGGGGTSSAVQNFQPVTYDRASDLQFVCGQSDQGSNPLIKSPSGSFRPTHAVFFECPIGHVADPNAGTSAAPSSGTPSSSNFKILTSTLSVVGYYIEFSNENDPASGKLPGFLNVPAASWRYRLLELNQPSQNLGVYATGVQYASPNAWFASAVDPAKPPAPVFVTADNVIALVVRPKVANPVPNGPAVVETAPNYSYDTKAYLSSPVDPIAKLSKNQLPPLVQITLVAIDTDSATRLASRYGATHPPLIESASQIGGGPLFSDVRNYNADLTALETVLQNYRLNYRVFVTDVSVPGAKWSPTN